MVFHQVQGLKGRALHASVERQKGERLLEEAPIVAMQLPYSALEVVACSCCLRPIGTVEAQLKHLTSAASHPNLPPLPLADEEDGFIAPMIPCARGCGARFCSALCAGLAETNGHKFLCAAASNRSDHGAALRRFIEYATAEWDGFFFFGAQVRESLLQHSYNYCNDVAILLLQIVCRILQDVADLLPTDQCPASCAPDTPCRDCSERAKRTFASFCSGVWWEISAGDQACAHTAATRCLLTQPARHVRAS